jgi:DNA-binding MarR family transcriptional regulator
MQQTGSLLTPGAIETFRRNLRVLEREVMRQLQTETACCGVTLAQCHVLLELSASGARSLKELVGALGLDKSTLSRTVEGLVKAGLVNRVVDAADRRFVRMTCTKPGLDRVGSINDACNREYAALLTATSLTRRQHIVETVQFLADAMSRRRRGIGVGAGACCAKTPPAPRARPRTSASSSAGNHRGGARKER